MTHLLDRRTAVALFSLAVTLLVCGPSRAGRFVELGGGAFTVSVDATGRLAYLANDSLVAVLDVPGHRIIRQYPTVGVTDAGPVDPTGTLLPIFGFDQAGVLEVETGRQRDLVEAIGGAYFAAVVANGALYAASYNKRVVLSAPLVGGDAAAITPYPNGTEVNGDVATPCELIASPDQTTVLMGDEIHAAVHAIRTSDNAVIATYPVGFAPCRLFFRDAATAVAVNAGQGVWSDSTGAFALLDLREPTAPVHPRRFPGLSRLQAAAVDPSGALLVLLYGGEPAGDDGIGTKVAPRVGVVNLSTRTLRARLSVAKARGFAAAVAITPDRRTILVGTTRGVQYLRLAH
jgi:DNA-binding beta-propeller fold protein YncE